MMYQGVRAAVTAMWGLWMAMVAGSAAAGSTNSTEMIVSMSKGQLTVGQYAGLLLVDMLPPPIWNWVPNKAQVSKLGPDFLWGVASSGFQHEGHAPDSNWTRYVANNDKYDRYGNSIDFYKNYEADLDRAAALGVKVFRMSIEWARVEPQPGVIDPAAWAFYDAVIQRIVKLGMRPMLTIDHWVYPGWMAERGGWASADMQANWLANAKRVVDRYAGYNPLWVTINETTWYLILELMNGGIKPAAVPLMADKMVAVHRAAYDYIHARQPGAMVTANVGYLPGAEKAIAPLFFDRAVDKMDFIGVDYYTGLSTTDFSMPLNLFSPWKIKLEPEGIYYALRHYAERYPKLPLYIVENSISTQNGVRPDGQKRDDALRDTVYWLQRAKADGIKVMGYNYWSLTDTYEWGSYTARFGLYTVNVLTDPNLTRVPTDAVAAYTSIIANQGVPEGYKPLVKTQSCSLVDPPSSCLRPVRVN